MSRVDEIRARLAAATPGPWKHTPGVAFKHYVHSLDEREEFGFSLQVMHWRDGESCRAEENAELIAHVPEYLAYLLGENERLRELLTEIATSTAGDDEPGDRSPRRAGWEVVQLARDGLEEAPDA